MSAKLPRPQKCWTRSEVTGVSFETVHGLHQLTLVVKKGDNVVLTLPATEMWVLVAHLEERGAHESVVYVSFGGLSVGLWVDLDLGAEISRAYHKRYPSG